MLGPDLILDRWQELDLMTTDDYPDADASTSSIRIAVADAQIRDHSEGDSVLPTLIDLGHVPALGGSFPQTEFPTQHFDKTNREGLGGHSDSNNGNVFLIDLDHAAIIQHDVLRSAFQLLYARYNYPDGLLTGGSTNDPSPAKMNDFYAWLRILTWTAPGNYRHNGSSSADGHGKIRSRNGSQSGTSSGNSLHGTNLSQVSDRIADLGHKPAEVTCADNDADQIYAKLLSRFKSCFDGNKDLSSPWTRTYAPYCLQTPLLAQVAIYTSSCFLHETGHLDKAVTLTHKGRAIDMLNAQLQGRSSNRGNGGPASTSTSDDAITTVIHRIMAEWYWGQTQNLNIHLRCLCEMIRHRGGFRNLGMNGLISKLTMAVMHLSAIHGNDQAVALVLETGPVLNGSHGTSQGLFDYEDVSPAPFRVSQNTPLVPGQPSFAQCAEALDIHPTTASILDDMRFLITAVLALPARPTIKDLQKVQTTAQWIHDRIHRMPADSPELLQIHREGDSLAAEAQCIADDRPSIVLSDAEPHHQESIHFTAQSPSYFDQDLQQQHTSSASPGSLTGHRGRGGSPYQEQPTPTPQVLAGGSLLSMRRQPLQLPLHLHKATRFLHQIHSTK
ncbi:hypothetical protein SPBR_09027 [Sporothrix brasiliensis 5110]|uniref:Uncharacterized protein n=1 Tax=Sporothrix brasiliensis 5110 TaxID=1398154 RepID=A0A0C2IZQ8_9PEZI|nr:uncharacterized protein SPBR_09027 [Sporothrix brasiliensis 5110]KIH90447.1 hypothetical protein SPBR_09027 [Sporothrix brasiliensis 5110]